MNNAFFDAFTQLLVSAQNRGLTEGTVAIGTRLSRRNLPDYEVVLPFRACCNNAEVSVTYLSRLRNRHRAKIDRNLQQIIVVRHGPDVLYVNRNELRPLGDTWSALAQHVLDSLRRRR